MHPRSPLAPFLALVIAAMGIAGLPYLSWLWCATASSVDAQLRPTATVGPYTPPPGPIYLENDSYYWLSYAQRIARGEDWRIRHTMMDAFPTGREVHWSQVTSWAMVLFGKVRAAYTGESLFIAVERASVAINPLLYVLAATGLFVVLSRRLGMLPSALMITFLGSLGDVGWMFQALRPGHQGFHLVFGVGSVLGLLLGGMSLSSGEVESGPSWSLFHTIRLSNLKSAKRWFLFAGFATGLALWVSATIESFFIYPMMGAFVLLLLLIPARRLTAENVSVHPNLWRYWGLTAGGTGLFFYLLEYFPHHMTMRMEVNHPVYDVAVVGCGELLRSLMMLRWERRRSSATLIVVTALALAVAVLPLTLTMLGPITWHHMRDPQMLRLHNFIQEFYIFSNYVKTNRLSRLFNLYGVVPLISLLAPLLLLRRDLSVSKVVWLTCTFAYACSFAVVGYIQIRWLGFYAAFACLSALVAGHIAFEVVPKPTGIPRTLLAFALSGLLLVQPAVFFRRQFTDLRNDLNGLAIENEVVVPILNKRIAYALKASPASPKAVIADPGIAPALGYFGGIPCLTSFYWENLDGLHDATRFLAAKNPEDAHAIAIKTGATHVIIPPDPRLPISFYFIAYGHYDVPDTAHTFVARLLAGTAPLWIQPDTVLNFITNSSYSYRGLRLDNRLETFRIQDQ